MEDIVEKPEKYILRIEALKDDQLSIIEQMEMCVLCEELENEQWKAIEQIEKCILRNEAFKEEQLKIIQKHGSNPLF